MNPIDSFRDQLKLSINQQFHIEGDVWLVPCVANYIQNTYKPLLHPLSHKSHSQKSLNKQGWTLTEDEILSKLIESRGTRSWSSISSELNAIVHKGVKNRTGKICRERWLNHLNPELVKGGWTSEEDGFIVDQHDALGKSWSQISKKMRGRNENSVKNRYNCLMKKQKVAEKSVGGGKNEKKEESSLMSPKIVNFDISDWTEKPQNKSIPYQCVVMRPISERSPRRTQVKAVKDTLRNEVFDTTPSPSIFLR